MIGIYLSTVRFVDAGVCYDPFHNHTKIYNNASYDTTYHTATYVLSGSVTDTTGQVYEKEKSIEKRQQKKWCIG